MNCYHGTGHLPKPRCQSGGYNFVDVLGVEAATVELPRFDIGHDEGTMKTHRIGDAVASVTIELKM